jgi:hypothetical protein
MSWCSELLRRIQLAAHVNELPAHNFGWSQWQERVLEFYQHSAETFASALEPAAAMYGNGTVCPANQLPVDALVGYNVTLDHVADLYDRLARQELDIFNAPPKAPIAFDAQQLSIAQ